jgi:outer membrane protein assembly factor BamB
MKKPLMILVWWLAVCTLDLGLRAEDWPQFLGPRSNGISSETGLLDRWPTNGPPILWEKAIGTGYSAPSVRGDLLVLHHRFRNEEIVEAFQAATGDPVWRYAYPSEFIDPYGYNNGPRSSPLLTADRCYTFGAEGKLLCLELQTGKLVWQRDTGNDWDVPPAFLEWAVRRSSKVVFSW